MICDMTTRQYLVSALVLFGVALAVGLGIAGLAGAFSRPTAPMYTDQNYRDAAEYCVIVKNMSGPFTVADGQACLHYWELAGRP
jgi:Na+-driven multidrug efflux pump